MNKPVANIEELANYIGRDHRGWDHREITYNMDPFDQSASAQAGIRAAFDEWSRISNIQFKQVHGYYLNEGYNPNADIVLATDGPRPDGTPESFAFTRVNGGQPASDNPVIHAAYIDVSHDWAGGDFQPGSEGYKTLLHEIGHAIGLEHSGPYNRGDGKDPLTARLWANDTLQFSIMSYNRQSSYFTPSLEPLSSDACPVTPMLADIVAAQTIYGANPHAAEGDTTYGYNATPDGYSLDSPVTIYDTGGVNTIDDSGSPLGSVIDLRPEHFSSLKDYVNNVAIAPGTIIQNALGGVGSNHIIGNTANNHLQGGPSDDLLYGADGNDTLNGGPGDDYLDGGPGVDTAVFSGSASQYSIMRSSDIPFSTIIDPVSHRPVAWSHNTSNYTISGPGGTDHLVDVELLQFGSSPAVPLGYAFYGYLGGTAVGPAINVGVDLNLTISSPGNENWFQASLTAGTTYWFNAEGSSTSHGTLMSPYLQLLGADGVTVVASDAGGGVGTNASMSYTSTSTGIYYVRAGSSDDSTGTYFLTERLADDYPRNPATNGILAAGGSVVGTYDFVADTDWFRTTLTAGTTYRFDAMSTPTGPGTQIHPMLWLYGDDGATQVASDLSAPQSGGYEASFSYTPTIDGTYHVSVGSYGTNVGTYRLSEAVISGATPSLVTDSRMSFIAGSDGTLPAATAAPGVAMIASWSAGNAASGVSPDASAGTVPPDQLFASAGPVTQPQYTAGDSIRQSAASLITGTSDYTTSNVPVIPYLSAS